MSAPDFVITNGNGGDDLTGWYTEEEAAEKLGMSLRSFQRFVAAGSSPRFTYAPEKRQRRREGKRPESVYNPQDVDALAAAANMRVVPQGAVQVLNAPAPGRTEVPQPGQPETTILIGGQEFSSSEIPAGLQLALGVMDRLAGILERQHSPAAVPQLASPPAAPEPARVDPEKLWLLLPEAAIVSGLSKSLLRKLAPQIAIRDGGRWKFPRAVLANSDKLAELARSLPEAVDEAAKDFERRYNKGKLRDRAQTQTNGGTE